MQYRAEDKQDKNSFCWREIKDASHYNCSEYEIKLIPGKPGFSRHNFLFSLIITFYAVAEQSAEALQKAKPERKIGVVDKSNRRKKWRGVELLLQEKN